MGIARIATARLLTSLANDHAHPLISFQIMELGRLLARVGARAAELDDPELNRLMCQLTIYTIADPHSPDYDPDRVAMILREGKVGERGLPAGGSPVAPVATETLTPGRV